VYHPIYSWRGGVEDTREPDCIHQLKQDMKRERSYYVGRFVDFLKQEHHLKDTPEGLHQHVREIEAYIRLHIQEYPVSPDRLIQRVDDHYDRDAAKSVKSKVNNAFTDASTQNTTNRDHHNRNAQDLILGLPVSHVTYSRNEYIRTVR